MVHLWLRGGTAKVPASVVVSLLLPDLPAFLRWRGKPPFGKPEFEQLIEVADRLIVDSAEWPGLPGAYRRFTEVFDRAVVSDLAWAADAAVAGGPGRPVAGDQEGALAPGHGSEGGGAPARRLAALAAREGRTRCAAPTLARSAASRSTASRSHPAQLPAASASDLLSEQLEVYGRDRVYEAAVRAL